VTAVPNGEISLNEACISYQLSHDEFRGWLPAYEKYGLPGLRCTRVQIYSHLRRAMPDVTGEVSEFQPVEFKTTEDAEGSKLTIGFLNTNDAARLRAQFRAPANNRGQSLDSLF
jgi:hypothetical protein